MMKNLDHQRQKRNNERNPQKGFPLHIVKEMLKGILLVLKRRLGM